MLRQDSIYHSNLICIEQRLSFIVHISEDFYNFIRLKYISGLLKKFVAFYQSLYMYFFFFFNLLMYTCIFNLFRRINVFNFAECLQSIYIYCLMMTPAYQTMSTILIIRVVVQGQKCLIISAAFCCRTICCCQCTNVSN